MKVRMIITTRKPEENGFHRSEVWNGELDILDENEYLVMISIMAEGKNEPICQIPFATGIGHYHWVPPDHEYEEITDHDIS